MRPAVARDRVSMETDIANLLVRVAVLEARVPNP